MKRILVAALSAVCVFGCKRAEPTAPPAPEIDATAPTDTETGATEAEIVDAEAIDADGGSLGKTIGLTGGTVHGEGATLTIPFGAVATDRAFRITRVTGDALADWPRGTVVGFVFEPADERFRIPATIELPHAEGGGEIMCQSGPSRMPAQFDETPVSKPFPIHVAELPSRCAVYSPEHAKALRAARAREVSQVKSVNKSFHWELKGKVCDPHELVRPNAGKDLREPPGLGGCPAGMAPVPSRPGVCVDRWEAHVVEVLEDGTEHTWSPYFNPSQLHVRAKSAPGAVPQGYISQLQAGAACAAAKKRLCRDDEWVLACKGPNRTQYPYGNEEHRGTCNDQREPHPAIQYLESHDLSVFSKLEHPCINQVPNSLLPTGAKNECVTPPGAVGGVYDIVGNLHEWTADPSGHFRGGYYVDTWLNGHGCDYVTTAHQPRYWDYSTGFRCCADAKDAAP